MKWQLATPAETERLGTLFAGLLQDRAVTNLVVELAGELGAGKTAWTRAVIQALGYTGPVVSPSYTLVESYTVSHSRIYHLDLYRLGSPEELELLGIRDMADEPAIMLIEWAEQGMGFLPAPDLRLILSYSAPGREAELQALSNTGRQLLDQLTVRQDMF